MSTHQIVPVPARVRRFAWARAVAFVLFVAGLAVMVYLLASIAVFYTTGAELP